MKSKSTRGGGELSPWASDEFGYIEDDRRKKIIFMSKRTIIVGKTAGAAYYLADKVLAGIHVHVGFASKRSSNRRRGDAVFLVLDDELI